MVMSFNPLAVRPWAAAVVTLLVASVPLQAQTPPPDGASKQDCTAAQKAEPATPVEKGATSGSKNIGATGWSGGGLGGSHNQTTNSGATPSSPTVQPETATGLDPTKSPPQRTAKSTAC
jgi:hypothetical protein